MRPWRRIVDLTHPISPEIPIWPGDPRPAFATLATVAEQGYNLRRVTIGEHTGTHIGVAAHLRVDGLTLDRLGADELVLPAVVLDVRRQVENDPDFALSIAEVQAWEAAHGLVPRRCVVLMATGWDARWPDEVAYLNADECGVMHFPGFAADTVSWLVEQRQVAGLGIDTPGIDPGRDAALQSNHRLLRGRRFHLENLTRLCDLPPTRVWLFIGALPLVGGSGSPARVLALV
ncbi:MAG: cyclase family protein [Anaerolineae bacterium]|nr:cyclase family protein [Anaerolineae bacterium]